MSEPTGDRAVSTFLDYLALACIFGVVEAATARKWGLSVSMLTAALVFYIAGIAWPKMAVKFGARFNWALWNKRASHALRVMRVVLVLAVIAGGLVLYYEVRALPRRTNRASPNPSASKSPSAPNSQSTSTKLPVDWHDKHNWRKFLHIGMTKTEVRQIFGEPERISAFEILEDWDYGDGRITFDLKGHPDGSLYSWSEP